MRGFWAGQRGLGDGRRWWWAVVEFEAHLEGLPGSIRVWQHHGLDAGEGKGGLPMWGPKLLGVWWSLILQLKLAPSQLWMGER